MPLNRKELLIDAGVLAAAAVIAGCVPQDVQKALMPTPFADNRPIYPPTPQAADLKAGIWVSAFNSFINPETTGRSLNELDSLFPDPLVKNRVAQVLIDNDLAGRPGGALRTFDILRQKGRVIGVTLCADSRVICETASGGRINDTVFFAVQDGTPVKEFAAIEQRSLGAAPRVFNTDVSILATHCNGAGDFSGCGALQALSQLRDPGGADILKHHGIAPETIDEILQTLKSANPNEQAVIAAKLQAMMSANSTGRRHITIAARVGHADKSMEIIDAFDNFGNRVNVADLPDYAQHYLAVNGAPPAQIDAYLAKGQKPFEYVALISDGKYNIQELMGPATRIKGVTFKVTGMPQGSDLSRALNMTEIKQMVAAVDYPLDHDWGKLFWIIGRKPEEIAALKQELLAGNKTGDLWLFLNRGNTLVEATVDAKGKITGTLKITRIKETVDVAHGGLNAIKAAGLRTEVILADKALKDAQRVVSAAVAEGKAAGKYQEVVDFLAKTGKVGLKIVGLLNPLFNAMAISDGANALAVLANYDLVYDRHNIAFDGYGKKGGLSQVMTMDKYLQSLKNDPALEPYLISKGLYDTAYTHQELAGAFTGLVNKYIEDKPDFNGLDGLRDLRKVLIFDYKDPNAGNKIIKLAPASPLVFYPLPVSTSFSPDHIDFGNLDRHPFMILNTSTGEFLITGVPGEMILPVQSLEPRNNTPVTYYLYLHTDEQGMLGVKNVGYELPKGKNKGAVLFGKGDRRSETVTMNNGQLEAPKIISPESRIFNSEGGAVGYSTDVGYVTRQPDENITKHLPESAVLYDN